MGPLPRSPQLGVEVGFARRHAYPALLDDHAFGPQSLALLAIPFRSLRECDPPVRAQYPVPGQLRIAVLAEDARHHPRPARQPGALRDVAVTGDLSARDGA